MTAPPEKSRIPGTQFNAYEYALYMLREWRQIDEIEGVLDILSGGIRDCAVRFDQFSEDDDPEYVEAVTAELTELIEDVLGVAFVTCQVQVGRIAADLTTLP